MWGTVELREIRVFLALAEELHFGRAAERTGVTQSRVSQSLRELELKLGVELVHRTSRRVALTAAGERFLAEIGPAHESLVSALEHAAGEAESAKGQLWIGLLNAVPQPKGAIELLRDFEAEHPGCTVEVKELPLSARLQPLLEGEVDVVLGPPPDQDGLEAGPTISRDLRVLAVAADHPLAGRSSVTTEDIADNVVVDLTGLVPSELAPALIPERSASGRPMKRRRLARHDWSELVTSIARGRIVHPAFEGQFAHPGIRCVPIADMPEWETVVIHRSGERDPLVSRFLETAARA